MQIKELQRLAISQNLSNVNRDKKYLDLKHQERPYQNIPLFQRRSLWYEAIVSTELCSSFQINPS